MHFRRLRYSGLISLLAAALAGVASAAGRTVVDPRCEDRRDARDVRIDGAALTGAHARDGRTPVILPGGDYTFDPPAPTH